MRRWAMVCAWVVWVGVWCPRVAWSDTLESAQGQPLVEVAHTVDAELRDGVVTYTVRRAFLNNGSLPDEAVLGIDLPPGASATGLRLHASARRQQAGALMGVERAWDRYSASKRANARPAGGAALLRWMGAEALELRVSPVLPGRVRVVEYTLTAPTSYAEGRHRAVYPRPMAAPRFAATAVTLRSDAPNGRRVWIGARPVASGAMAVLPRQTPREALSWWRDGALVSRWDDAYAVVDVQVDAAVDASSVRVNATATHPSPNELRTFLVSPRGTWYRLAASERGQGDGVRLRDAALDLGTMPPAAPIPAGVWRLVVADTEPGDAGYVQSFRLSAQAKPSGDTRSWRALELPRDIPDPSEDADAYVTLSAEPSGRRSVEARLGHVSVTPSRGLMRLEVEVASALGAVPEQMAVAFVIDASHSQGEDGVLAQVQAIRAYLKHAPHARVHVIAARRDAAPMWPTFESAPDAARLLTQALQRGDLAPTNGSALGAGLKAAQARLASEPGARRVVAFTDALLASRWSLKAHLAATPDRPLTHIVVRAHEPAAQVDVVRLENTRLAPLALQSGGIVTQLHGLPADDVGALKRLDRLALGWVRPARIDGLSLEGLSRDAIDRAGGLPSALEEGEGVRLMALVDQAPAQLTLTGTVWAKPYRKRIRADRASNARAAAALLTDQRLRESLDDAAVQRLAQLARVVSPATSLVAARPDPRFVVSGFPGLIDTSSGRIRHPVDPVRGWVKPRAVSTDLPAEVAAMVQACRDAHGDPAPGGLRVRVETTRREIVDVYGPLRPSPLAACIVEGLWAHRLTKAHTAKRAQHIVRVR